MPELKEGEISRRDKGIRTAEVCPNCLSIEIDVEPAYKDGECVGSRYICRDCGWSTTFEESGPEDAVESQSQIEREITTVDAVTGWLEAFKEAAVGELQETSDLDKADQKHLQSKIQVLDELSEFFEQGGES